MISETQATSGAKVFHIQPGEEVYVTLDIPGTVKGKAAKVSYCVKLTYEDLLSTVSAPKKRPHLSKKSKVPEVTLSRHICLIARAIETGKWSTGRAMQRPVAVIKLMEAFAAYSLSAENAAKLTSKARSNLIKISNDWTCMSLLHDPEYRYFMEIVEAIKGEQLENEQRVSVTPLTDLIEDWI